MEVALCLLSTGASPPKDRSFYPATPITAKGVFASSLHCAAWKRRSLKRHDNVKPLKLGEGRDNAKPLECGVKARLAGPPRRFGFTVRCDLAPDKRQGAAFAQHTQQMPNKHRLQSSLTIMTPGSPTTLPSGSPTTPPSGTPTTLPPRQNRRIRSADQIESCRSS